MFVVLGGVWLLFAIVVVGLYPPHLLGTSSYSSFCGRWGGWLTNLAAIVNSPFDNFLINVVIRMFYSDCL